MAEQEVLSADSLLSSEKAGGTIMERVVGSKVYESRADRTSSGIPRIQTVQAREQPPMGPSGGLEGTPTITQGAHKQAEEHHARWVEAAEATIPRVEFWAVDYQCSRLQPKDGYGRSQGSPTYCRPKCPCLGKDGTCAENAKTEIRLFTRRVQPSSREEFQRLLLEPGAAESRDTTDRIQDEMNRRGAIRAEVERKEREAIEARDNEIKRLRKLKEREPKFTYMQR